MTKQRGYAVTAAAAGAGLALFAASRVWAGPVRAGASPRTGGDLMPWLPALALAALAGAGAVLATRGVPRALVGGLLVLCGSGVAAGAASAVTAGRPAGWPALAAVGALAVLGAGLLILARGRSWPALGARYQRSRGDRAAVAGEAAIWDALDRGEDPTRD